MPSKNIALLDVQDLHIEFAGSQGIIPAVKGIDLRLEMGEVVGLVGESGSGKSVTALAIMRLLDAKANWHARQMRFHTDTGPLDLQQLSKPEMGQLRGREISMIFQDPMSALNPIFTCGEQVAESLRWHLRLSATAAKSRTLDWFAKVHLPEPERMFRSFPHQLSGGQQQRVMVAMAMCCHPSLLIADEPTTALDVTIQAAVLDLMRELRESENTAILFISHDLGVVRTLADRVMVMHRGQIVEENTTHQLFAHPQATYTQGLLACRPPLDRRLYRLPTLDDRAISVNTHATAKVSPEKKEILLEVKDLNLRYVSQRNWWGKPTDWVHAVDQVHFTLRRGESLGIVGESGSGKTSLGRTLVGLAEPQEGSIVFKGEEILRQKTGYPAHLRAQIQMVFQNPYASLNPRMQIGKAISEPLSVHRPSLSKADRKKEAKRLLEMVGLREDMYHRYPREFSGGQRQRIAIARALILQPALLICDEAVSALDVSVQAQVLNLLKDLQEQIQFSLLFISHDLSVVRFMCDHCLVMHQGKIVEKGPTKEIIESPQKAYTQQLVAAVLE